MARMKAYDMDDTGVMNVTGFLETFSKDLGRSKHMYPVMKFVFERMDEAFTLHMSAVAPSAKSRFHHVYEWNAIGVPQAKLWDTTLSGSGTSRNISFTWRASKTAVPIPKHPAGPKGEQLQGGHIFVWKAPMMEYAMSVTIDPIMGDFLAFPANQIGETAMRNGLWFSRGPERFDAPPNSRLAAGQFTKEFLSWWSGGEAERAFDTGIKDAVEQGVSSSKIEAAMRTARGNSSRGANQSARNAAHRAGKKKAKEFLNKLDTFYGHRTEVGRKRDSGGRFAGWNG